MRGLAQLKNTTVIKAMHSQQVEDISLKVRKYDDMLLNFQLLDTRTANNLGCLANEQADITCLFQKFFCSKKPTSKDKTNIEIAGTIIKASKEVDVNMECSFKLQLQNIRQLQTV